MSYLLASLLFFMGMFLGLAIGGWAVWKDAKRCVKQGLVDWKKEEIDKK